MYIWEVHKYNRCSNPFAMCEHQTFVIDLSDLQFSISKSPLLNKAYHCRILWNKRIAFTFMDSKYFLLYIFSLVKFWVSIHKDVLSTENVDHGNRLRQVCLWYATAAGAWDREGWWLHCDSLPLTGPFRYLVIISHHQQWYRNHYLSPPSESSSPTSTW